MLSSPSLTLTFLLGILATELLVSLLSSLPHTCPSYHTVSDFSLISPCAATPTEPESVVKKYLEELKSAPADEVR